MGRRGRAEGLRGHEFFWSVKQRAHDFFWLVKQRGQNLFWSVKQRGHDFFIHSKQWVSTFFGSQEIGSFHVHFFYSFFLAKT